MDAGKSTGRWHQFTLRALLVFVAICALGCGWMAVELRKAHRRYQVYQQIQDDLYTTNHGEFPWYSAWLHRMVGTKECYNPDFLVFNNFGSVNDNTMEMIGQLDTLEQLWLNGDITITDAGLEHLKRLTRLRDLSLADAPVTAEAVERLRDTLPDCEISWQAPRSGMQSRDALHQQR